jgi:hypothetical protein
MQRGAMGHRHDCADVQVSEELVLEGAGVVRCIPPLLFVAAQSTVLQAYQHALLALSMLPPLSPLPNHQAWGYLHRLALLQMLAAVTKSLF